ncbi:MAG: Sec-independent protein translocase protein TatB [Polymorphobacter sp.]
MFGIESSELAIIALVALLVIGPKDLPRVMRMVGGWVSKGRAMTRHVRAGFDTMMREAELEEMQKQWAAQNEAIMKATALPDLGLKSSLTDIGADDWMLPPPPLTPEIVDIAPAPPPATKTRKPRAKPVTKPAADAEAPKPKRAPRKKVAAPQATDS